MRLLIGLLAALSLESADLIVAAASDLAPLERALKAAYGPGLRFSFGSSGSLLRQIENGAPYDVFLSASEKYTSEGIEKGVLLKPAQIYATGRIALWSRSGAIRTLDQLRDPKLLHLAIANPAYAPYGAAAKQALENAGLWKELSVKIVYGENIRQTLQYAESGNTEAAIVAWSLVHDRGGILIPNALHTPIRQSAAIVAASKQQTDAAAFLQFLTSPKGQAVLSAHGLAAR